MGTTVWSRLTMKKSLRYTAVVLFFLIALLLWITRSTSVYESALNSLFITFDDFNFGPTYLEAIDKARKDYFDFDFPEVNQHPANTIPPIIHFIWYKDLYNKHLDVTTIPHEGSEAPSTLR